jgi:hypothetical protein
MTSGFVDAADPQAVEAVLRDALALLGADRVLETLATVVPVRRGRAGGLFRDPEPDQVAVGDRLLRVDDLGRASLQHVVGGIVLATDPVMPAALPGVLASLVTRSVADQGSQDAASVVLTALRDAVSAGS